LHTTTMAHACKAQGLPWHMRGHTRPPTLSIPLPPFPSPVSVLRAAVGCTPVGCCCTAAASSTHKVADSTQPGRAGRQHSALCCCRFAAACCRSCCCRGPAVAQQHQPAVQAQGPDGEDVPATAAAAKAVRMRAATAATRLQQSVHHLLTSKLLSWLSHLYSLQRPHPRTSQCTALSLGELSRALTRKRAWRVSDVFQT
jgi:hypothetical protein